MKRLGSVILIFLLLGLWQAATPRGAYACSCAQPPEPRDALEQATSVFSGLVVDITTEDTSDGFTRRAVTFDIISSWKGTDQARTVVRTGMDSADCGFNFEVGQRYLVYTSGDTANPNTGICDRTKLLRVSGEDIAKLGPGKPPVAKPAVQPTVQPTVVKGEQASIIPYVVPALAVVVILVVLFLVMFRRKSA